MDNSILKTMFAISLVAVLLLSFNTLRLNSKISNLKNIIKDDAEKIAELTEQKSKNEVKQLPSHPIEIKTEKCIAKCSYTNKCITQCTDDSIKDWEKIIGYNFSELKKISNKKHYKYLDESQKKWTEYKDSQSLFLSQILEDAEGTQYVDIIADEKNAIYKNRAQNLDLLLNAIKNGTFSEE